MDNEITILEEAAVCYELGIEPLDEAGGLLSWVKRALTHADMSVVESLNGALATIQHEDERDAIMDDLKKFITEAENARDAGFVGDVFSSTVMGIIGGAIGATAGAGYGAYLTTKMVAPVGSVGKFMSKVPLLGRVAKMANDGKMAAFKAQKLGTVVQNTISGLAAASLAMTLVSIIIKTVMRYGGGLDTYIDALRAVHMEARAIQFDKQGNRI